MRENVLKILKDYQKEFVLSDKNIVIGNFSRGAGKSFTLLSKVIYEQPKVCFYVSKFPFRLLEEHIKNVRVMINTDDKKYIKQVYMPNPTLFVIEYSDGNKTEIWDYINKNSTRGIIKPNVCDIAVFDEVLPILNIQSRKYISCISTSANLTSLYPSYLLSSTDIITCGVSKLIKDKLSTTERIESHKKNVSVRTFYNEIDILYEYDDMFEDNSMIKLIDEQIKDIMNDFKNTTNDKTIRKRDLLTMVKDLIKIKEDLKNENV